MKFILRPKIVHIMLVLAPLISLLLPLVLAETLSKSWENIKIKNVISLTTTTVRIESTIEAIALSATTGYYITIPSSNQAPLSYFTTTFNGKNIIPAPDVQREYSF